MKKTRSQPVTNRSQRQLRNQFAAPPKLTFIAHVHELRRRLFYAAAAVGLGAGLAYSIQETLTRRLLQPAGNQQFIYTTPGGGFDFQFKLCLYTGLALAIPVIIYNVFKYIHPLLRQESKRFLGWMIVASSGLALTGIGFGYYFGLPAAMHFLLQSFSSERIAALITIQSYMSFVLVYLLGSALLFQIPLILLLTNRIKPLQPKKLMQSQRWFVIAAFVLGAIISPTPDIRNQLVLTGPIIGMYELSVLLIWIINRRKQRPRKVLELLQQDATARQERQASFEKARVEWRRSVQAAHPTPSRQPRPLSTAAVARGELAGQRPRKYVQEFRRPAGRVAPQAD